MNNYTPMFLTSILLFVSACSVQNDTTEQNKNLTVKANQEILNNGNIAYVDSVFSEDYKINGSEMEREAIKDYVTDLTEAFPDLKVTIEPIVAEGDLIGWQRTSRGTHQGQIMGIPASSQEITWRSIILTRISDGKIVEEWSQGNFQEKLLAIGSEN